MEIHRTNFLPRLLIISLLAVGPFLAGAVSNSIPIGLTVNTDVVPPSQPTGFVASALSSSQIDLTWNASTDNVAVTGYVVRRGGAVIATTSATNYPDSGLVASTLYSYTVTAFDAALNYSTPSLVASATTTAGGGGGGGGDTIPPSLTSSSPSSGATGVPLSTTITLSFSELIRKQTGNIVIRKASDNSIYESIAVSTASIAGNDAVITLTTPLNESTTYYVEVPSTAFDDQSGNLFAGFSGPPTLSFTTSDITPPVISSVTAMPSATTSNIIWSTNELAKGTLSIGTTTDYALASAAEVSFSTNHGMVLGSLSPGTVYYFRITAADQMGNSSTSTGTFTTDTPPIVDLTPPANVSGLTADAGVSLITLNWTNPSDVDFAKVRIMRSTVVYPLDQNDGVLVYEGTLQTFVDTDVVSDIPYYYTVFTRDEVFNYSSGSPVSAVIVPPPPPPPPPPATTTPPGTDPIPVQPGTDAPQAETPMGSSPGPTNTASSTVDLNIPYATSSIALPFTNLPPIENLSPALRDLSLNDFSFTELGPSPITLSVINAGIRLDATKRLRVSIFAEIVPDILKTLAVTIADPKDPKKSTTVLLRLNPERTAYEGDFDALKKAGEYPLIISVLDHQNRGGKLITGTVNAYLAESTPSATSTPIAFVVEQVNQAIQTISEPARMISPVATPAGLAVGATQAVLLVTNVQSFADIYLLILRIISAIAGLFRRKRSEPWGVVYDSVTKRPLDPAYVIARGPSSKSKGEAITDLDGRYGFVLEPGEYIIEANKTHYKFPSTKMAGKSRDELYDNLYFGKNFKLGKDEVVKYNIPLDPVEFDWNEYAKVQDKVFKVYSKRDRIRVALFNVLYYVGFAFSAFSFATNPQLLNGFICLVYLGIILFQMFWKRTHRINRILRRSTGAPVPFALVKVYIPELNAVVKKTVADELGRFYFLVPPGQYMVTVEEKLPDESYREVLRTQSISLSGGVMLEDLIVG